MFWKEVHAYGKFEFCIATNICTHLGTHPLKAKSISSHKLETETDASDQSVRPYSNVSFNSFPAGNYKLMIFWLMHIFVDEFSLYKRTNEPAVA